MKPSFIPLKNIALFFSFFISMGVAVFAIFWSMNSHLFHYSKKYDQSIFDGKALAFSKYSKEELDKTRFLAPDTIDLTRKRFDPSLKIYSLFVFDQTGSTALEKDTILNRLLLDDMHSSGIAHKLEAQCRTLDAMHLYIGFNYLRSLESLKQHAVSINTYDNHETGLVSVFENESVQIAGESSIWREWNTNHKGEFINKIAKLREAPNSKQNDPKTDFKVIFDDIGKQLKTLPDSFSYVINIFLITDLIHDGESKKHQIIESIKKIGKLHEKINFHIYVLPNKDGSKDEISKVIGKTIRSTFNKQDSRGTITRSLTTEFKDLQRKLKTAINIANTEVLPPLTFHYPYYDSLSGYLENGELGKSVRANLVFKNSPNSIESTSELTLNVESSNIEGNSSRKIRILEQNQVNQLELLEFGENSSVNVKNNETYTAVFENLEPQYRFTDYWLTVEQRQPWLTLKYPLRFEERLLKSHAEIIIVAHQTIFFSIILMILYIIYHILYIIFRNSIGVLPTAFKSRLCCIVILGIAQAIFHCSVEPLSGFMIITAALVNFTGFLIYIGSYIGSNN